jgi:hypothetical protein
MSNAQRKKLGPFSRFERKLEKTPAAKTLGKAYKTVRNDVKTLAKVSTVGAGLTLAGLGAALAADNFGIPPVTEIQPHSGPNYSDPYFLKIKEDTEMKKDLQENPVAMWMLSRRAKNTAKDVEKRRKPKTRVRALVKGMFGEESMNENLGNAIDQIVSDGDVNSARDILHQVLASKASEQLDAKKQALAKAFFTGEMSGGNDS